jgi:hypothetical protein
MNPTGAIDYYVTAIWVILLFFDYIILPILNFCKCSCGPTHYRFSPKRNSVELGCDNLIKPIDLTFS